MGHQWDLVVPPESAYTALALEGEALLLKARIEYSVVMCHSIVRVWPK